MIERQFKITRCAGCDRPDIVVIDSRPETLGRYRRKLCRSCGRRYSTLEVVVTDDLKRVLQRELA